MVGTSNGSCSEFHSHEIVKLQQFFLVYAPYFHYLGTFFQKNMSIGIFLLNLDHAMHSVGCFCCDFFNHFLLQNKFPNIFDIFFYTLSSPHTPDKEHQHKHFTSPFLDSSKDIMNRLFTIKAQIEMLIQSIQQTRSSFRLKTSNAYFGHIFHFLDTYTIHIKFIV